MTSSSLRQPKSELSGLKLILMMAIAASKAAASLIPSQEAACKPRANCLKLKEIRKGSAAAAAGVLTCGNP
jgi:hypothetical protein